MALQPSESLYISLLHDKQIPWWKAVYVYQTDLKNKQNIIIKQDLGLRWIYMWWS